MTKVNHTHRTRFYFLYCLTTIIALFFSNMVSALLIGGISTSPSGNIAIKDNQVGRVVITWSGASDSAASNNPGSPYQVYSTTGVFSDSLSNFSIENNRRITTSLIVGTVNPFSIREVVQIPRSVLFSAKKNDTTIIEYSRTFIDNSNPNSLSSAVGTVVLQVTQSAGGLLSISQIDLRFSDNLQTKVVRENQALTAKAIVSHSGSGLFDAVWEIATPTSTAGIPVFTTLDTTRKVLSGHRTSTIETPLLPTALMGNYLLRLRIKSPATSYDVLQLQYTVIKDSDLDSTPQNIPLLNPQERDAVNSNTLFRWSPVDNAIIYRLEIIEAEILPGISGSIASQKKSEKLLTGLLLTSDKSTSQLSKLVMQNITAGNLYQWRVIAFDEQGRVVGKSQLRSMWFHP